MRLLSFSDRWIRPPADLRKMFAGHERALAVADVRDESQPVVVATNVGLWVPESVSQVGAPAEPPAGSGWRRIGWDRVVKANWADDKLVVIEGDLATDSDFAGLVTDRLPISLALTEPRNLPAVVRTRVETSIARSEQVNLPGGTGRIVARRVPGVDGLTWTARFDSSTPDTPADRAVLLNYLARATSAPTE